MRTISAAEANRQFSKLLRQVTAGETVIVTSRGKPVATLAPIGDDSEEKARREEAWRDLMEHLRSRPALNLGRFDRGALYDD